MEGFFFFLIIPPQVRPPTRQPRPQRGREASADSDHLTGAGWFLVAPLPRPAFSTLRLTLPYLSRGERTVTGPCSQFYSTWFFT